jgi:hypothetical protein
MPIGSASNAVVVDAETAALWLGAKAVATGAITKDTSSATVAFIIMVVVLVGRWGNAICLHNVAVSCHGSAFNPLWFTDLTS